MSFDCLVLVQERSKMANRVVSVDALTVQSALRHAKEEADLVDVEGDDKLIALLERLVEGGDHQQASEWGEIARELLVWDVSATDRKRSTKSALQVLKWRFLTWAMRMEESAAVLHDGELVDQMKEERFALADVQHAMAECVIAGMERCLLGIVDVIDLIKQFYVTLPDPSVRQQLASAVATSIKNKDTAKAVIRAGFLRAVLQIAMTTNRTGTSGLQEEKPGAASGLTDSADESKATTPVSLTLMQNCTDILHRVGSVVSPAATVTMSKLSSIDVGIHSVCTIVVGQLMLSRVAVAFEESIRLLQMLVEDDAYRKHVITIPDLRGALEMATILATKPTGKPTVQDEYVRGQSNQLYAQLTAEIDSYERVHGSLVDMPQEDPMSSRVSVADALKIATKRKVSGNKFFRRGNFGMARLFYRRSISIIRAAECVEEQRLASLSTQELIKNCSIGASVHVVQRDGTMRPAIVCDDDDINDGTLEVLYDTTNDEDAGSGDMKEEEEVVSISRIRLRMSTNLLEQFKTLAVDCAMNMGKAFAQLHDYDSAVQCFNDALAENPDYIAALYHRGVAHLVLHDLRAAQQDLWRANQRCRQWKTRGDEDEAKRKAALGAQISTAYKRLQLLHANKKKMDKKLVKQMMSYLSTIPGLQDE